MFVIFINVFTSLTLKRTHSAKTKILIYDSYIPALLLGTNIITHMGDL